MDKPRGGVSSENERIGFSPRARPGRNRNVLWKRHRRDHDVHDTVGAHEQRERYPLCRDTVSLERSDLSGLRREPRRDGARKNTHDANQQDSDEGYEQTVFRDGNSGLVSKKPAQARNLRGNSLGPELRTGGAIGVAPSARAIRSS